MALHTLGTSSTTALNAVTFNPASAPGGAAAASQLSPADLASIAQGIMGDGRSAATNPTGVKTTGTTHSSTLVDAIASMSNIRAGMMVLGVGIVPGTFITAINVGGSSVTLSQAATASAAGVRLLFAPVDSTFNKFDFNGTLYVPGRGTLKVFAGDVVAIDNTGWPILLSAATIAYAGSLWSLV